ncbi:nucleolar protein 12 isoform X1 [Xenopus laevis]|uniref:Nucleolar protein 12 n=1 Tax=Xenopus laevis TaxID=8355 RepID=A0A8J0V0B3_XENLA|nr:nucleolar protein 12 isoform X1 [Xenopus laevis]
MGKKKQKKGQGSRLEVIFDEEKRREYLTGFHKRKMQRRKTAVEEIKRKIKEEQKKMKEERHKEYMKMLKEREEALCELEENDELEEMVTSKTESVRYDHPNHTVTVTTISDLDLSGIRVPPLGNAEKQEEEKVEEENEKGADEEKPKTSVSLPKKSGDPFLSKKICSLTASLHARSQRKSGKRPSRTNENKKQTTSKMSGRTSKTQRRKQTGKTRRRRN